MALFIFDGPTHDLGKVAPTSKVTLKLPLQDGQFQIIRNVEPGVTQLAVTDPTALAFVRERRDLHGQALYREV